LAAKADCCSPSSTPFCGRKKETSLAHFGQVLLAEKRTSLAALGSGIAVFALPLSVLSVLIATSRYYSMEKVMPLLILSLGLVALGSWLIFRSIGRIHHYEHRIKELTRKYHSFAEFVD
jgi:uncharacterized membrane protein YkgB